MVFKEGICCGLKNISNQFKFLILKTNGTSKQLLSYIEYLQNGVVLFDSDFIFLISISLQQRR